MTKLQGTGAFPSQFDLRTFKYPPAQSVFAEATDAPRIAGTRWEAQFHFDQFSIGTCTATPTFTASPLIHQMAVASGLM